MKGGKRRRKRKKARIALALVEDRRAGPASPAAAIAAALLVSADTVSLGRVFERASEIDADYTVEDCRRDLRAAGYTVTADGRISPR